MSKILYAFGSLLLTAVTAVSLFGFSSADVGAASEEIIATVPVEQIVKSSDGSSNKEFSYLLTAEDNENPLPEGGENGSFKFSVVGNHVYDLEIAYHSVGSYYYILNECEDENLKNNPLYDHKNSQQYRILVSVKNGNKGLVSQIIAYNQENDKAKISYLYEKGDVKGDISYYPRESTPSEPEDDPQNSESSFSEETSLPSQPDTTSSEEPDESSRPESNGLRESSLYESSFPYTRSVVFEESKSTGTGGNINQSSDIINGNYSGNNNNDEQAPLTGDHTLYFIFVLTAAFSGAIAIVLKTQK